MLVGKRHGSRFVASIPARIEFPTPAGTLISRYLTLILPFNAHRHNACGLKGWMGFISSSFCAALKLVWSWGCGRIGW
jgi:hypothetical protein